MKVDYTVEQIGMMFWCVAF